MFKTKTLLMLLMIAMVLVLSSCVYNWESLDVEAKVLSVNENILEGRMIGALLSSASGHISNDVIKFGIQFTYKNNIILTDIKVSHAVATYYKDTTTVPLRIYARSGDSGCQIWISINGVRCGYVDVSFY